MFICLMVDKGVVVLVVVFIEYIVYNNQSWSRMCDRKILSETSYSAVRNETSRVSDHIEY